MAIDFANLVLGPNLAIFARPITVTPVASQPDQQAFLARGIWSSKPIDVQLQDGSIGSSQEHTLGIRISEFAVPLAQGDQIEIDADGSLPRVGVCLIEDGDDDGQGGTVLSLKIVGP